MTAGAVALLILKILGLILLGIVALIGLICLIPAGVTAEYGRSGAKVLARVGPIRVQLYPRPPKKRDARPRRKKQKPEVPDTQPEELQEKRGGGLPMFRELTGLVMEAQRSLRNKLRITQLTIHLTVGGFGQDPDKKAILYGQAWAAIGNLMPLLLRSFRIGRRSVGADIDFTAQEHSIYVQAALRMPIGAMLRWGLYFGGRGYFIYRKHTKKGGTKDGTSSQ